MRKRRTSALELGAREARRSPPLEGAKGASEHGARRAVRAIGLVLAAVASASCARPPAQQPISFNHRLHAYNNVPCLVCHPSAADGQGAGLPAVHVCRRCHEDVLYESEEKAKIRLAFENGRGIDWVPIYALHPYVYFSHRRHVTLGHINCKACHGDVELRTSPFQAAESPFGGRPGMKTCIDCHRKSHSPNAGVDCLNCHR
jgi:hypothetical protein